MTSIKDIARNAGVSVGTVSRVINGASNVSPARRSRVEQTIKELDYQPHPWARGLRSKRSHVLGLLVPDIANPFFAELARAVSEAASERGYDLLLAISNEDADSDAVQLRSLAQRRVDGLIMVPSVKTTKIPDGVKIQIVAIDRRVHGVDSVSTDQQRGMTMAAEHLVELGHRRIGFISGPRRLGLADRRRRGWASVSTTLFEEDGLDRMAYVVEGSFDYRSGYQGAESLLGRRPQPTAIICSNDQQAIGAVRAIVDSGLTVPHDISIVGFDDISLSSQVTPRLTTVAQPFEEIGRLGVERLTRDQAAALNGRSRHVVVEPRLVERESTGKPAAARH